MFLKTMQTREDGKIKKKKKKRERRKRESKSKPTMPMPTAATDWTANYRAISGRLANKQREKAEVH